MNCNVCGKKTKNEDFVIGWAVLCSKECEDILYKKSFNELDCKSCEDKCEIKK